MEDHVLAGDGLPDRPIVTDVPADFRATQVARIRIEMVVEQGDGIASIDESFRQVASNESIASGDENAFHAPSSVNSSRLPRKRMEWLERFVASEPVPR